MSNTRQPIPNGVRSICWMAFRDFLVNNDTLGSYGIVWDAWDGDEPPAQIPALNFGDPPYVRLTPMGILPNGWVNAGVHDASFAVRVDITVPGNDPVAVMNAWEAIEFAIWPGDFSGWNAISTLCATYNTPPLPGTSGNLIISIKSVQPAIDPSGGGVTNATGAFNLLVYKPTQ